MDKGTHFYKCDFQVHTPRDINWNGDRPTTPADRQLYASAFVNSCRDKGINAVAITDHHDFGFYPFIKEAANNELDENGQPIEDKDKLVVFPGLELTLSTPSCQAILIVDASYPINDLTQILHLLAITPTHPDEPTTVETTPISNSIINGFEQLYEKLNTIEALRGKFIVLPNLNDGGRHTLLRAGNSEHYRKMPCVGGYVDGSITQHKPGKGNHNIIHGLAREYGHKSVALFQTSDNRRRDFSDLGNYTTWVKWAEPTAEAIRQACLAKESRLTHVTPKLPQIYITKIDVTNSKFLSSFNVEFNQQYNALIGGRGTGKSTILEYLRWGLCDQTITLYDPESQSEVDKRRHILIEKTLVPFGGEVRITFSLNGITHIIKRNSNTKEILLKIGAGEFDKVNEDEIRRILPIQAYSQKQLSSVGVRTDELKRFIQQPIASQLNNLKFQLSDNTKRIKTSYNSYVRKQEIQNELEQYTLEIRSLNNQVENLRNSLSGISEEDQIVIAQKQKYDNEQNFILRTKSELSAVSIKINELVDSLNNYPEPFPNESPIQNNVLLSEIDSCRKRKHDEIKAIANQLKSTIAEDSLGELNELLAKWKQLKDDFEIKYNNSKEKASSNQQQLKEIERIEKRLQEVTQSLNERQSVLKELGRPENDYKTSKAEWLSLHQKKVDILNEQAQYFSQLSKGIIKAEVTKSIDIDAIKSLLISAFVGTRIREDRVITLCEVIVQSQSPLEKWSKILDELKLLAEQKISDDKSKELPETPILTECSFNEGNKTRIIEILTPEKWLDLSTKEIEFSPMFLYSTNNQMGDVIPFSDASAGQQATALLTVLLSQDGTPLIIDQPEDDIDNRAIDDIIKNIWAAKKNRQLIFTSHNANLVVNGDAELVVCCDYRDSGDQTRGIIKEEGSIDSYNVKNEITTVMEGGEKAFRLRKDKYGF